LSYAKPIIESVDGTENADLFGAKIQVQF